MNRSISSRVAGWIVAAAGLLAVVPAWADGRIGVVDFQRLGQESPQGKEVFEALRAEFAPRERTLQAQGQALKTKQEKLQKDGATMTDDQRGRAEKELRDGARDFERARGELQDDETARRNEQLSRLQRTLVEEVRGYAKAQNLDLVVSGEAVLYATPAYDITPAILAALQVKAAAAPAAKPATPAAAPAPATPPAPKPNK
ncbi:MAG TPA: OmpH family outer membrane protein [Steroidobacteraceae bacterium]|nr:OmpH family outer membrane protein [Steroidobacteraceae bacterium]